ncbi:MAG: hypothetical protein ACKVT0_18610 [Planctomycetaceae bacterium]
MHRLIIQAIVPRSFVPMVALALLMSYSCSGCGGSAPPESAASGNSTDSDKPSSKTSKNKSAKTPKGKTDEDAGELTVDDGGRKWIGNIPLDVWFDSPLEIVNTEGEVASTDTNAKDPDMKASGDPEPMPKPETPSTDGETTTAPAGSGDWGTLLPLPVIETEIKLIRSNMNSALQSVSQYNAHYKEIQVDGALLSLIAAVMPLHPESLTWKPNAKHVRHLAGKICTSSTALGKKSFDATKAAFEQLTAVLDGSLPPDLEDVPEEVPFSEAVARNDLMKRLQIAYDWMKKNVPAENVFKEQAEKIRHEASLVGLMGTIIGSEGYSSSDEEGYKKFASLLVESSHKVIEASNNDQFDAYNEALGVMYKSCTDCHVDYRGE